MHLVENADIFMFFRLFTAFSMFLWWIYWRKEETKADREKPKTQTVYPRISMVGKYVFRGMVVLTFLQNLGLSIFSFQQNNTGASLLGMLLIVLGIGISVIARREIAANWANGYEYQIKKGHELVMSGIYSYIRHPIYTGIALLLIGGELTAQSYLWISYMALFGVFYFQGKREEKLLLSHFGKAYKTYMKKSKMLIPFVF